MNKKIFIIGLTAIMLVAAAAINVNIGLQKKYTFNVTLNEMEASANIFTTIGEKILEFDGWWDSAIYDCEYDSCWVMVVYTTIAGTKQRCETNGNSFAHCWDCVPCY